MGAAHNGISERLRSLGFAVPTTERGTAYSGTVSGLPEPLLAAHADRAVRIH